MTALLAASTAPATSAPTAGQLALLILCIALFAAGGLVSMLRLRRDRPALRAATGVCMWGGLACAVAVLVWHSAGRGSWVPLSDNFEALTWLAVLLALLVVYVQRTRGIPGLDWFVMPIVILLLLAAGHFGTAEHHPYARSTWTWVHLATSYAGAAAFALAAAGGAMYILASRRLRRKAPPGPFPASLERLEHLTMHWVTLGFALLTIGLITGGWIVFADHKHTPPAKVALSVLAWLVYAVVLHAPINPRFRGRRAAALSVFGFLLMVGTLIAVQLLPGGAG